MKETQPLPASQALTAAKAAGNVRRGTNRRLYLLLGALAGLAAVAVVVYSLRGSSPALPEIPEVDLDGADPEIARAFKSARAEVERAPRAVQAWGELAAVSHANGFDTAADVCYQAAETLAPSDPTWPYLRGYLLHNGPGGPLAAVSHFERAARGSKPGSVAQIRFADVLLELDRLEEAEREYLAALAADNRDAQAAFGLGELAIARRQPEKALHYLLPIAGNPLVQARACSMRASVFDQLGDKQAAETERKRLSQLPEDQMRSDDPMKQVIEREIGVQVMLRNAQALWNQHRVDEMMSLVRDAIRRYPNSDIAWASLGAALATQNDSAGAEDAFKRAIALGPKTADHRLALGRLQLAQRRYHEAEETFRKAIDLNSHDGQARFSLGECLLGQGDRATATEAFRQALRYAPDLEPAKARLKELDTPP